MERSLTKRLQTAFAARDGVESALLAACGVTAPAQVFEGQAGFEALYTALDAAKARDGLGREYRLAALTLKKHASCFCNHAAIEAALEIVRRHGLRAADVSEASVRLSPYMARLVGAPFAPGANPQVAAQFSAQYSVASVLQRGRFSADDILPAAAMDAGVGALAKRVRVEIDAANDGKFVPATVTVRTRGGAEFSATTTELPGTPAHPMTDVALRDKALACFAGGARPLAGEAAERVVAKIARIDTLQDMNELWKE